MTGAHLVDYFQAGKVSLRLMTSQSGSRSSSTQCTGDLSRCCLDKALLGTKTKTEGFFLGMMVCLFACLLACLLAWLLAWLLACLVACLFVCLLACLLVCLFVCLLVYPFGGDGDFMHTALLFLCVYLFYFCKEQYVHNFRTVNVSDVELQLIIQICPSVPDVWMNI